MPVTRTARSIMEEARSRTSGSLNILRYPADLEAVPHKMLINVRSRSRGGAGAITTTVGGNTKAAIALPIPSNITEYYSANYEKSDLGIIGEAIANAASAAVSGGVPSLADFPGRVGSAISAATSTLGSSTTDILANIVGAIAFTGAVNLTTRASQYIGQDTNALRAFQSGTGLIFNPHQTAVFTGVNLRDMKYTWELLAPKTEQESRNIEEIVSTLRNAMLPKISSNRLFLEFPDEVEYKFLGSAPDFDMPTTPCVITNVSLNRSPRGPAFFAKTGAPAFYSLTLSLMEIKTLTRDDFIQNTTPAPTPSNPTPVPAPTNQPRRLNSNPGQRQIYPPPPL